MEEGTDNVDDLMNKADRVYVSSTTEIETLSTFRRLLIEKAINENDYKILKKEFETDYQFYTRVDFDDSIVTNAKLMIEKYQLKSLDSIQLGTMLMLKDEIDFFVVCDDKLIKAGKKERLKIINPID